MKDAWKWSLLAILILILLAGCRPVIGASQTGVDAGPLAVPPGKAAGQTFSSRFTGLTGIDLYLAPGEPITGKIRLHLRSGPQDQNDLTSGAISLLAYSQPGFVRFSFSPQTGSSLKDYYILVENTTGQPFGLGSASGDSYIDGSAYLDGQPLEAQLAFRLVYDPWGVGLGLLKQGLTWLGLLLAAAFLFLAPGWALLRWLFPGWVEMPWQGKIGLSGGLSLAVYPIFMLWTSLVNLQLGPAYAWLPPLAGLVYLAWKNRRWRPPGLKAAWANWKRSAFVWSDLASVAIIALIVIVRLWVIQPLDVPMWGDSYQHTLITQLIVDHNGLFNSWQPYADLATLTYHFGFHSAAAAFHWITSLDLPQSVLFTGQVLNILAVLALYPLVLRISRNRWAAAAALLIAGLASPFPMEYINWGRYTQLAGQVILPAAVVLLWQTLEDRKIALKSLVLPWILLAGLGLTHYRILLLAILFLITCAIANLRHQGLKPLALNVLLVGIGSSLLFLPWFIHTASGNILKSFGVMLTTLPSQASQFTQDYNAIGSIFDYFSPLFWLLMAASIGLGFWKRNSRLAWFCLWWSLIVLATNPQWLRLPGQGIITNFALIIAAYIPISVLIGSALGSVLEVPPPPNLSSRWVSAGLLVVALTFGTYMARQRIGDVQPGAFALVTRPDIRAASWIKANTPPESGFLVNAFFAYGNTAVVGSDSGWWLPLLANRRTDLPPLTYTAEQGPSPGYVNEVNDVIQTIQARGLDHPDILAMMQEKHFDYVYIGQRQGRVNYDGRYSFDPQKLAASPFFRLVYHQDRVWIFQRIS